jgi:hypothetical protein
MPSMLLRHGSQRMTPLGVNHDQVVVREFPTGEHLCQPAKITASCSHHGLHDRLGCERQRRGEHLPVAIDHWHHPGNIARFCLPTSLEESAEERWLQQRHVAGYEQTPLRRMRAAGQFSEAIRNRGKGATSNT